MIGGLEYAELHALLSGGEVVTCEFCCEAVDINECEMTWQQWQCPCCGSWNDREEEKA